MVTLVLLALFVGVAIGFVTCGLLADGRHREDCEFCAKVRTNGAMDFRA